VVERIEAVRSTVCCVTQRIADGLEPPFDVAQAVDDIFREDDRDEDAGVKEAR
jgi:hypothetical protein